MRKIATIPARDREALFRNAAAKIGMREAIIEKRLLGLLHAGLSFPSLRLEGQPRFQRRHQLVKSLRTH